MNECARCDGCSRCEPSNVDWNYMMAGHDPYKNDKGEWVPCDCMACEKRYG